MALAAICPRSELFHPGHKIDRYNLSGTPDVHKGIVERFLCWDSHKDVEEIGFGDIYQSRPRLIEVIKHKPL